MHNNFQNHPGFSEGRICLQDIAGLPRAVKNHLYAQDSGFEVVRVINDKYPRLVLHVRLDGKDRIIKTVKKNIPWKRPGRYFRFQKEIFIYTRLNNQDKNYFKHPGLISTDEKSFIITEYIPNDPSLPRDHAFFSQAVKAVLEMNACDFPYYDKGGPGWLWEKANRWKFSRTTKTLRNILEGFFIRRIIPVNVFIKAFEFWKKSVAESVAMSKPILLHRDIFKANILRPDSERLYFIDFEKMGMEKRWVFSDVLKIVQADPMFFQGSAGVLSGFPRFYIRLLEIYWDDLMRFRPELRKDHQNFKRQLKFCLLGWTLKKLVKEKPTPQQKKDLIRFLEAVILGPEHNLQDWMAKCPQ